MKHEIRIRLEGISEEGMSDAWKEALFCIRLFRSELPDNHKDCYYVSAKHNCLVRRTKAGTLIAVVRQEVGRE